MSHDFPQRRKLSLLEVVALSLAVLLGGFVVLRATASFSAPLVAAMLFATLLDPAADWLVRRRVPGPLATAVVLLVALVVVTGLGALGWVAIVRVAEAGPTYATRLQALIESWLGGVRDAGIPVPAEVRMSEVVGIRQIMGSARRGATALTRLLSFGVFFGLYLAAMVGARRAFAAKFRTVLEAVGFEEARARELVVEIGKRVQVYLALKTAISLVTGVIFGAAAALLGLDFPVAWGLLAFLLNYIPSLGPIIATMPPAALAFVQFEPPHAIVVVAVLAAIQFLSGNVVEPILVGDRLKLNFVVVLLAVSVGGLCWGFPGMVLSVPIVAAIKLLLAETDRYGPLAVLLGG